MLYVDTCVLLADHQGQGVASLVKGNAGSLELR